MALYDVSLNNCFYHMSMGVCVCVCVCVCYGGIDVTTHDDNQTNTTDADTTLIAAIVGSIGGLVIVMVGYLCYLLQVVETALMMLQM